MNEVLRNVTELKTQGQHLILGNPWEDEKFSWFSHRVISDVLSEPNYFKSVHSSTALPHVNLRFTRTFRELISDINDRGSKANPGQLFRCFKNSSSVQRAAISQCWQRWCCWDVLGPNAVLLTQKAWRRRQNTFLLWWKCTPIDTLSPKRFSFIWEQAHSWVACTPLL